MASTTSAPSTTTLFHTLIRPCILQILRAQGYHSTRTSVLDAFSDLAGRYLFVLCEEVAQQMRHNGHGPAPSITDVRLALQAVGATLPENVFEEQEWLDEEDTRGMDGYLEALVAKERIAEIRRVALDGEVEHTDYLSALIQRHSKSGEDSKYVGTVLGRDSGGEHMREVIIEGAEVTSIHMWEEKRAQANLAPPKEPTPEPDESAVQASRSPSSGLSSLGDEIDDDMDLS